MRSSLAKAAGAALLLAAYACGSNAASTSSASSSSASSGGPTDVTTSQAASTGTSTASSAAGGASSSSTSSSSSTGAGGGSSHRGFPVGSPWVSFYGGAQGVDLAKTAGAFRVLNIDADPDTGNFTDAEITTLKASGKNRVISYMNVGACEMFRSYWSADPAGHKSCQGSGALTTAYGGYPDEMWADLSNPAYRDLIVNYVAPRLAGRGVDGFFLDNLEVVEHGAGAAEGPCDAACSQGGLDLVYELRQKFPDLLIVMQNATSDTTRLGKTHGLDYPSLLDGVSHEEIYSNGGDAQSQQEMQAWKGLGLVVNGSPFWLGAEDYVGSCSAADKAAAQAIYDQAKNDGLNEYVTDASAMQSGPCFWADF